MFNFGHEVVRTNATQRPPRVPTNVQRLGHIVVQTPKYIEALNWYLDTFGMIVSDFCLLPGPARARADPELHPLRPRIRPRRPPHPGHGAGSGQALHAFGLQVADLDALAAGGEYLREQGYFRSWGIGRHIQGSQIFDYWRDPDGFLVEHFADGDMFDNTLEPGWAPLRRLGPGSVGTAGEQGLPGRRNAAGNRERTRRDARRAAPRQRIRPVRPARAVRRRQLLILTHPTERKKNPL